MNITPRSNCKGGQKVNGNDTIVEFLASVPAKDRYILDVALMSFMAGVNVKRVMPVQDATRIPAPVGRAE